MKTAFALIMLALFCPFAAQAQNQGPDADHETPIEVTADKTLEWHRAQNQYTASGNAIIRQGDVTIRADEIVADYRDTGGSNFDVYRLTATGGVAIDNRGSTATGDRLVYDVDTGLAVMTGDHLTMTSPEQTVTAQERFEYAVTGGKLKAVGQAKVVRAKDTLQADIISAVMKNDATGKSGLDRLEATGNVVITTPAETLRGAKGVYTAATDTADITGGVTILRGQNELCGERASVDLTSNVSRMFGSGSEGGRVRGIFYPEKKTR